ncbi:fungal specific transcription factor [Aspergillus luchuensis]|uniref:Fungal specific transcription factor n=1 Tax=Aspergillus kawachii TaxID=1069201 RepID=A0A146F8S0_ASPKA|nr:fungal specific transcription factor [Aspergillus luchuensis]
MGRPMRINIADCSTRMPHANDSDNLLAGIPEHIRKKYLPEGTKELSKLWTELLTLTVSLAKILSWQNRADQTRPSRTEIQQIDDTIRQHCFDKDHGMGHAHSHVVSLHMYHLELYREGKDAATNTNRVLGNMIGDDMISNCQAMVCIALVPTLQIHLLDATSEKQMVQRMGRHNLEFCMMVIEELKSVYFGAELLSRMFTKARDWILYRKSVPATAPREYTPQSSRDFAVGSLPVLPDDACQDDAGIFDAFATMLSPFASVSAGGLFNNDDSATRAILTWPRISRRPDAKTIVPNTKYIVGFWFLPVDPLAPYRASIIYATPPDDGASYAPNVTKVMITLE